MSAVNPWLTGHFEQPDEPTSEQPATRATGPLSPQSSVSVPPTPQQIPFANRLPASLWFLGVHGGAGETTLSGLNPGWQAADHRWPSVSGGAAPVVLVARTHVTGLRAAQAAAIQWASGSTPEIQLLGLALVQDAPGKLPKELRELIQIISGGVPRTWSIPWVEAWRLGADPASDSAPKDVRRFVTELDSLTGPTTKGNHP